MFAGTKRSTVPPKQNTTKYEASLQNPASLVLQVSNALDI